MIEEVNFWDYFENNIGYFLLFALFLTMYRALRDWRRLRDFEAERLPNVFFFTVKGNWWDIIGYAIYPIINQAVAPPAIQWAIYIGTGLVVLIKVLFPPKQHARFEANQISFGHDIENFDIKDVQEVKFKEKDITIFKKGADYHVVFSEKDSYGDWEAFRTFALKYFSPFEHIQLKFEAPGKAISWTFKANSPHFFAGAWLLLVLIIFNVTTNYWVAGLWSLITLGLATWLYLKIWVKTYYLEPNSIQSYFMIQDLMLKDIKEIELLNEEIHIHSIKTRNHLLFKKSQLVKPGWEQVREDIKGLVLAHPDIILNEEILSIESTNLLADD